MVREPLTSAFTELLIDDSFSNFSLYFANSVKLLVNDIRLLISEISESPFRRILCRWPFNPSGLTPSPFVDKNVSKLASCSFNVCLSSFVIKRAVSVFNVLLLFYNVMK